MVLDIGDPFQLVPSGRSGAFLSKQKGRGIILTVALKEAQEEVVPTGRGKLVMNYLGWQPEREVKAENAVWVIGDVVAKRLKAYIKISSRAWQLITSNAILDTHNIASHAAYRHPYLGARILSAAEIDAKDPGATVWESDDSRPMLLVSHHVPYHYRVR